MSLYTAFARLLRALPHWMIEGPESFALNTYWDWRVGLALFVLGTIVSIACTTLFFLALVFWERYPQRAYRLVTVAAGGAIVSLMPIRGVWHAFWLILEGWYIDVPLAPQMQNNLGLTLNAVLFLMIVLTLLYVVILVWAYTLHERKRTHTTTNTLKENRIQEASRISRRRAVKIIGLSITGGFVGMALALGGIRLVAWIEASRASNADEQSRRYTFANGEHLQCLELLRTDGIGLVDYELYESLKNEVQQGDRSDITFYDQNATSLRIDGDPIGIDLANERIENAWVMNGTIRLVFESGLSAQLTFYGNNIHADPHDAYEDVVIHPEGTSVLFRTVRPEDVYSIDCTMPHNKPADIVEYDLATHVATTLWASHVAANDIFSFYVDGYESASGYDRARFAGDMRYSPSGQFVAFSKCGPHVIDVWAARSQQGLPTSSFGSSEPSASIDVSVAASVMPHQYANDHWAVAAQFLETGFHTSDVNQAPCHDSAWQYHFEWHAPSAGTAGVHTDDTQAQLVVRATTVFQTEMDAEGETFNTEGDDASEASSEYAAPSAPIGFSSAPIGLPGQVVPQQDPALQTETFVGADGVNERRFVYDKTALTWQNIDKR